MASYGESLSLYVDPKGGRNDGFFVYENNKALNPTTLTDAVLDVRDKPTGKCLTQPNNSYWAIFDVATAGNNAVYTDDASFAGTWAQQRARLWPSAIDSQAGRTLQIPYNGVYRIEFRIAQVPHVTQTATGAALDDYTNYGVRFGIVTDKSQGGRFFNATPVDPDPLNYGKAVQYKDYDQTIDYSTIKPFDAGLDDVLCSDQLFVIPRPRLPNADPDTGKFHAMEAPPFTATTSAMAVLTAGAQLRFVVSNYNASTNSSTQFLPQMFKIRLTYITGDYKI